jgi:XTP/dITP diphosphohydrolase
MKLVIASTNYHKIREFRSMFKEFSHIDILSLKDFPDYTPPEESGSSFAANSQIKALDAAEKLGYLTLADDSGLIIPALNGEPGVYSARYAGPTSSDADNRNKLIQNLMRLPEDKRVGYYECSMTLASKEGIKKQVSGLCEGQLLLTPRGSKGFGYDSLFVKYDYSKTFAELDDDLKNKISHRRKAFDKLLNTLHTLFN